MYLRTHGRSGRLFLRGSGTPAAVDTPYQDWEYAPAVYFVQKYTRTATESPRVPALCRMVLRSASGGAPAFTRECVSQGVENLQVEIGVDTDEDGSANYFTQAPTAADLGRASTARVYLQVRSARADVDYDNVKTYQIGNAPAFTPDGADRHYYRKTLAAEVALHNPRALLGVGVQ
jgi:type IV pilus assembly protein PilW